MNIETLEKKIETLEQEQAENSMKLDIERRFFEVLCRDYTTVHYADLMNDIAEPLKISPGANASRLTQVKARTKINYTQTISAYCEKYVADSSKKEFLKVMRRENLIEELTTSGRVVYRYESVPNMAGHRYFEVQVVSINEDNFDGNVLVAFHHIDDIVTLEQRYRWELEKIAYIDSLTGLENRAAFMRELEQYGDNADAACVVADVNNLKLCNDRYGHLEGDKIISDAAECIFNAFGKLGKCYRIGGDEFCVLIPEADSTQILAALGDMERLVEDKNTHRAMPLSVACGYALRENNESMEHLFNRSDEMMYDVKYRMKKEFPVYSQERIKNYLNVLSILSKSTESFLYLWDIARDENWFFGDVDSSFAIRKDGRPMNKTADMEAIIHPADRKMLHDDLQLIAEGKKKTHNMNYRWMNRDGEPVWISCRGTVIDDDKGRPFVMIGMVSDKKLKYLYHPLTRLFNKNKMIQDLKESFLEKNKGYFMFAGIDNLANINLRFGRSYGDTVIKHCGEIMERAAGAQNIWHVENNCFALYLDVDTADDVQKIFAGLQNELSDMCTISAGVVPDSIGMLHDEHNLYECGEMTFEKAKSSGNGTIIFFSQQDLENRIKTIRFLEELQTSVDNGCKGFYLCYQPQVKTGNYQVYGAEALLRYHSDERGEVYPDEFIPLLEQSKLINQVGMWVLETALRQCREWREQVKDFRISVNFSAIQLREKDIADKVLKVLEKTGMPGSALTVEITESVQLQKSENFTEIFAKLRNEKIEISIDDFGTGYASMGYLKSMNVNEIKIDRMFVKGIEEATYNYRLISNMIEFAKNNSIRICCEGVESMQELTVLEGLSPNLIQGYLFAKPCKKETFEHLFIDSSTVEYRQNMEYVQRIYKYKDRMQVIYFNTKDILRKTDLGLWIIRINEEEQYYEMHADETMERVIAVDKKYTPQECYRYWFDRIKEGYVDYVRENVKRMIESDKVVQLQYPWIHPELGEVVVRCSGKRVEDSDGFITLEGYHRIISNIEEN